MGSWKGLERLDRQHTKETAVINEDLMPPSSIYRLRRWAVYFVSRNDYAPQIAPLHPGAVDGSGFGIKR